MKRRAFLRSLGGAVAAAMMPFIRPIEQPKFTPWYNGILALLKQSESCALNWYADDGGVSPEVSRAFVDTFFFGKTIPKNEISRWLQENYRKA
jgi:hypothetical protein